MTLEFFETDEGSNALWKRGAYEEKLLYLGKHRKRIGHPVTYDG